MRRTPRLSLATLLMALLAGLTGCPRQPLPRYAGVDQAREGVLGAREAARAARDARDLDAASRAAELAVDGLAQAEALSGPAPVGSAAEGQGDPLRDLRLAAREAQQLAQETDERLRLEAALSGLKAGAYRQVRGAAVGATFTALALAARQAEQRGLEALPPQARDAANCAAAWAEAATGRGPRADGTHDWAAIAADMERLAGAPPPQLGVTLSVGFLLLGKSGLALLETEALDPAAVEDPTERLALHLLRGFARDSNGYRRLAVLEVEEGLDELGLRRDEAGTIGGGPIALTAAEVVGGIHLLLAVVHMHEKDYPAADRELALALAAWPDSPVASYLTGERLLASGQRERATASLEAAAQGRGEDAEWLAARIADRSRRIRDGEADADDGLIGDPAFMARLALHALWKAAERSPQAAQARAQAARARAFCADLLGRLPGLGEDDGVAPIDSTTGDSATR